MLRSVIGTSSLSNDIQLTTVYTLILLWYNTICIINLNDLQVTEQRSDVVILTLCVSLLTQITARFYPGCCRISFCPIAAATGCAAPIHRPFSGSVLHALQLACGMAVSFVYLAPSSIYSLNSLSRLDSSILSTRDPVVKR